MKKCSAYIYFGLSGDFAPSEFDARIPLEADKCEAKHSRDPAHKLPRTTILRYAEHKTFDDLIDIYVLSDLVVDVLMPYVETFKSAIEEFDAEPRFQVVLHFPTSEDISTPAFGFSTKVINFIALVGGHIDIDTYRR